MKTILPLHCAVLAFGAGFAPAQVDNFDQTRPAMRVYPYWTSFLHPDYGYQVPVPPTVRAVGPPEAATLTNFVSPDGAFVMTAWGGVISQPPKQIINGLWTKAKNKPGRTVNYERRGDTWYVVSGTDRTGTEFYEKFTMRGGHVAAFTLTYPRSHLREFEPWVEKIENSFAVVGSPEGAWRAVPAGFITTGRNETALGPSTVVRSKSATQSRSAATNGTKPKTRSTPRQEKLSDPPVDVRPPESADRAAGKPERPTTPKPEDAPPAPTKKPDAAQEIPYGKKIPGKPGFVFTPFLSEGRMVDVEGFAAGTKVECPFTKKVFRVP